MLYAIMSEDNQDSLKKRLAARPSHLERLDRLMQQGRLIVAGPHPALDTEDPGEAGFSGSLIIAEFASLEEAQKWANGDPYLQAGVYRKVTVKPFNKVYP